MAYRHFFTLIIIATSVSMLTNMSTIAYALSQTTAATKGSVSALQKSSDPSCANIPTSWAHTYDHSRFTEYTPNCITVSGKVVSVEVPGTKGGEPDGDYHFDMQVGTTTYSNTHNCQIQPVGGCDLLIGEIVCFNHSAITLHAAQVSCTGYKNQIFGPKVGQLVTVTGKWVQDVGVPGDHHYWNEIHPVTGIK